MVLETYHLEITNIECMPTSNKRNAVVTYPDDLSELLPYIAALIPGCTYQHAAGVINYFDSVHIIGIYPEKTTITAVMDKSEAEELFKKVVNLARDAAARMDEITPVYDKRITVGPLDLFKTLPGTNCRLCDEPTCMAFAAKIMRRQGALSLCTPLLNGEGDLAGAEAVLGAAGISLDQNPETG